jgi:hypothetical protein
MIPKKRGAAVEPRQGHRRSWATARRRLAGALSKGSIAAVDSRYDYTGGACVPYLHEAPPLILMGHLLADFHRMVIRDGLDPIDVHEALSGIYEYRRMIAPVSMPVRAVKRGLRK